jgi:hypothetical protein
MDSFQLPRRVDERIQRERRGMPPEQVEREIASLRRRLSLAGRMRSACNTLRANSICPVTTCGDAAAAGLAAADGLPRCGAARGDETGDATAPERGRHTVLPRPIMFHTDETRWTVSGSSMRPRTAYSAVVRCRGVPAAAYAAWPAGCTSASARRSDAAAAAAFTPPARRTAVRSRRTHRASSWTAACPTSD